MNSAALPEACCAWADFGPLTADPQQAPWSALAPLGLRLNTTGGTPQQGTEVRVGRDLNCLRVLFVSVDSHPWATFTERDAPLYKEEVVEVFLDTVGDGWGYFELEVNPNNAVLDLCMRRVRSGFRKDFSWRCEGLETVVRIFEGGWAAELSLPFASLTLGAPQAGEKWRVNFTRIDRPEGASRELSAWSPTGFEQFHMPDRFGVLVFV